MATITTEKAFIMNFLLINSANSAIITITIAVKTRETIKKAVINWTTEAL